MIHYKTKIIPAKPSYEKLEYDKTTCDMCKCVIGLNLDYGQVDEVTIKYEQGTRFPEDTFITEEEYHICPACFSEKVVPLLKSFGSVPTIIEREY